MGSFPGFLAIGTRRCSIWLRFSLLLVCPISNISAEPASPGSDRVEIILKGAKQHFTFNEIASIERWGIVVVDGHLKRTALYRVIDTAILYDSTYVDAIKQYVSNLKVTIEGDAFIVSFGEAIVPELEYRPPRKMIDYKYYTFNLCLDRVDPLEVGFVYSLWPLYSLCHRIAVSPGYPYSKDPSYRVWAFNYGIGQPIVGTENYELEIWINYAKKFLEKSWGVVGEHILKDTFALGMGTAIGKGKKVFWSVNIGYYFQNVEIEGTRQKLRLLLGINVKI